MGVVSETCADCGHPLDLDECFTDHSGALYCRGCWEERRLRERNDPVAALMSLQGEVLPRPAPAAPLTLSAGSPEVALLKVARDQGPFAVIGRVFSTNKVRYVGPVLASPIAVYLVKVDRASGLFAGARSLRKGSNVGESATCTVYELPAAVKAQLDGYRRMQPKLVLIVPRDAISLASGGAVNNVVRFSVGADTVSVFPSLLSSGKARRALERMGWQFNVPVTPVAAPIHNLRQAPAGAAGEGVTPGQAALYLIALAFLVLLSFFVGLVVLVILMSAVPGAR